MDQTGSGNNKTTTSGAQTATARVVDDAASRAHDTIDKAAAKAQPAVDRMATNAHDLVERAAVKASDAAEGVDSKVDDLRNHQGQTPDRKSTRLNSSHPRLSRMPSSA